MGVDEGLKHESWITCDHLVSLPKTELSDYLGALSPAQTAEFSRALRAALDLA